MSEFTIVRDPKRCSGHPTVGATRLTVHDVIAHARLYDWDLVALQREELPHRSLEELQLAVDYYREHSAEIDAILAEREADFERGLRRQQEARRAAEGSVR